MPFKPVNHIIAEATGLPPISAPLYEYIMAGNGLFIRAKRDVMSATIPLCKHKIIGLPAVTPELTTSFDKVPEEIMRRILTVAEDTAKEGLESLFYLWLKAGAWQLEIPPQIRAHKTVEPCEKGAGSPYERAIIEIHSHHEWDDVFSDDDDRDETGFRIYGVIGHVNPARHYRPSINLRLGVYGNWWPLPAARVIEMPPWLRDRNSKEG
jgi:PRTRC genetic system protein A